MGTPWLTVGPERGGIQKSVFELSRAISRNHDVHIVCPSPVREVSPRQGGNPWFHYAFVREVRRYPIPDALSLGPGSLLLAIRFVFSIVAIVAAYVSARREHRFDVTYFSNKYVAAPILLMKRRPERGVYVYSERNVWPWLYPEPPGAWARFRYRTNLLLGKFVCARSDGVHVNSDSLREALGRQGIERGSVASIPNGVDVPAGIAPTPLTLPIRVGFVARLVEVKGVRILIDVIRTLNAEVPHMQFEVIGDGPLRNLILDANLKHCRLWGERPRTEVLDALRSIHIALFLSPVENVPSNALMEALALGKAVVATDVGDTPHFLSDRRNALLCPPNPASVADAVSGLCKSPGLYDSLTAAAQELAASYSWEAVARRHLAFYTSMLGSDTG